MLVHIVALTVSVLLGGEVTGLVVRNLQLVNDEPGRAGVIGAGQAIGYAERLIAYLAVAAGAYTALAALVAIKTIVRFPEIQTSARRHQDAGAAAADPKGGRFAEYYLVGTLVSLAFGIGCPSAARLLIGWWFG